MVGNSNNLDVLETFTVDDEVRESPDWQSTSATWNSDTLDGGTDAWILAN